MEVDDHDDHQGHQAPTPLLVLDRARRMAEVGRMTEMFRARSYRGNKKTAAAATARKTTKLLEGVPDEDLILQLMWEKACAPRHHYSPEAWKPMPNDTGDEQLAGVYQKARAIIRECDRHVDALILQYVNNNGGGETAAAAIDDVPTTTRKKKTKLVPPPVPDEEASVLNLMWHKACAPRRDLPAWRPRPNDTRVELIRAYEKGTAVKLKWHEHDDDLISQYINNGCAYQEV